MSQNLTNDDCTELARFLRQAIEADRWPLSPHVRRWKELLAKLDPAAATRPQLFPSLPAARRAEPIC